MKNIIISLLFITFCCSCSHSTAPDAAVDSNKTEDSIVSPAPQALIRDFRKDVIIALYMLGCNDRLEMGLPKDHTEDYWNFLGKVDSLVEAPDYFDRIESNLANDPYNQYLQDSLKRWLFLKQMLLFPANCKLDYLEYGITDELPQTHHLLDKYIDRNIQCFESLSLSQLDFYIYDMVNHLLSLPETEQMDNIIQRSETNQKMNKMS